MEVNALTILQLDRFFRQDNKSEFIKTLDNLKGYHAFVYVETLRVFYIRVSVENLAELTRYEKFLNDICP
jgi:hypothetical protein